MRDRRGRVSFWRKRRAGALQPTVGGDHDVAWDADVDGWSWSRWTCTSGRPAGRSRRVRAGRRRRGAQVEVGALRGGRRGAALLCGQVLGAGGGGWRVGVRV